MGATWIANAVWGGVDLAASMGVTASLDQALKLKTRMLMGMAKLMDESIWTESEEVCDITDWFNGTSPCQSKAEDDGTEVSRICVRSSPWDHHVGKIPGGILSPEGRCQPSTAKLLSDGLPCLTHEVCSSGYCHFDTRLQYFFSDHDRVFHRRGEGAVPIPDQLHSMQVQEVMPLTSVSTQSNYSSVR